jgi:hypothetical protein
LDEIVRIVGNFEPENVIEALTAFWFSSADRTIPLILGDLDRLFIP